MDYFGLTNNVEMREADCPEFGVNAACEECVKIKEMEATILELRARGYRHTIAILGAIIALLLVLIVAYLLHFDLGNPNYGIFRY